jgi:hypothetical protein
MSFSGMGYQSPLNDFGVRADPAAVSPSRTLLESFLRVRRTWEEYVWFYFHEEDEDEPMDPNYGPCGLCDGMGV